MIKIMTNDNNLRIKNKIDFFLLEKVKVHVELNDKTFWNGLLLKCIKEDVWLFLEDKFGEQYLFLHDVYDINKFQDVRK